MSSDPLGPILQALHTLYSTSSPPSSREQADRILTAFQRSPSAWPLCLLLLSPPHCAQHHLFAALTLHAKCHSDLHQLSSLEKSELRETLLQHLRSCADRPVVARLSMALAALAAKTNWLTVLRDIQSLPRRSVLEVAKSVIEEGKQLEEDSEYWAAVRTEVENVWRLCEGAVETGESFEAVLSCLASWIRLGDVLTCARIQTSVIVPWIFESLLIDSSNEGYEEAVDLLVEWMRRCGDMILEEKRSNDTTEAQNTLIQILVPRIITLGGMDKGTVAESPLDKAIQENDEDGMRGYCRIVTDMGEACLGVILSHEERNQELLVELVLKCARIPDKEIASMTLHFWHSFIMGLEELEPYEYRQIKIDAFAPQLIRLLAIFATLLQYPVEVDELTPDRLDDIAGIRLYFADVMEDCCRLLGGEIVLQTVGMPLQQECRRVASLPPHQQLREWHGIEAYFYAIQAVSIYVPSDENRVLPFAMGLIPQLPTQVPLLLSTTCQIVGKYASWLGHQPSYLQPLLPYLAQGLSIPISAHSAAVAIREICQRCSSLVEAVKQLYDGIVLARQQHQNSEGLVREDFILDLKNELIVLEGVCKSVTNTLTNEQSIIGQDGFSGHVNSLVRPILTNLSTMASPSYSATSKQISCELSRLTVIIQHLHLPRPSFQHSSGSLTQSDFILGIMREVWPLLNDIGQKYPRDFALHEKLCRLHKHSMRHCGPKSYIPMLQPLMEQIVKNFSFSLSSPYLYLASICISEYGKNPAHSQQLFAMVANLSSTVFQNFRVIDDFVSHPDVVEEFFYMAGRMVNHCPGPLVQSTLLHSLLQCAALGMKMHHRDANRGTLNFLESTVSYSLHLRSMSTKSTEEQENMAALEQAILAEGQPLVINLALALLGELPASRLDSGTGSIAGVLFYLNQLCPDLLMHWIQPPLVSAPEYAKSAFLVALHNQVAREEFNYSVRKFSSVCERSRRRQGYPVDESTSK